MRIGMSVLAAAAILGMAVPAVAGNVAITDGKLNWQSTQCQEPEPTTSLTTAANTRATAEQVNRRVTAYNDYVAKEQTYMDCLSQEAQADAKLASDAITNAAQQKIDDSKKAVAALGAPLQAKK